MLIAQTLTRTILLKQVNTLERAHMHTLEHANALAHAHPAQRLNGEDERTAGRPKEGGTLSH